MLQIPYGSSTFGLRFVAPAEWDIAALSGVDVSATDADGNTVLASDAATLYTATTLDGDVNRYADEFVLAAGSDSPVVGDTMLLAGAGSTETVFVKGYNSASLTVTTEQTIKDNFDDGDSVYNRSVVYSIDVSDTDTFTAGIVITVTWAPAGTGIPVKQLFQVGKFATDISELNKRFNRLYPRAYSAFTKPVDRFADMVTEAELMVELEFESGLMDYNRIIGNRLLSHLLMSKMACLWVLNADEDLQDEREALNQEYGRIFTLISKLPIWTDTDQDDIVDEQEVSSHEHIFQGAW